MAKLTRRQQAIFVTAPGPDLIAPGLPRDTTTIRQRLDNLLKSMVPAVDLNLRPPDYKSGPASTISMFVLTFHALFRCFCINDLNMMSEWQRTSLLGLHSTRTAPLFGSIGHATEERVREAEGFLLASELAITAASGATLRGFARPLLVGPMARSYQVGSLGLGVLLPLLVSRRRGSHWSLALAARLLALVGGAVLRRSVVEAGLRSADDPTAYFRYTGSGR